MKERYLIMKKFMTNSKTNFKKITSLLLAFLILLSTMSVSFSAFAASKNPWDYADTPTVVVVKGSKGPAVLWWQVALNTIMNSNLQLDSSCGNLTVAAIKAYQKHYNLTIDGSAGPESRKKMISLLNSKGYYEKSFSSKYYTKLNTFYIGNSKYYEVKLNTTYKGVSKGSKAYLTSAGNVVTNKDTLYKLLYTSMVNSCKSDWIKLAKNYKSSVKQLNDACQSILTAQFKQKVLGSISGSFTSIMVSKNPKSLISACTYLTEEGYIYLLTGILLDQVTDVAITNSDSIINMCSDGVNSYEEACKVKTALVNAKTSFDFAGTDCMLGLASKYTNMSKAVCTSLKTHFNAMFNTLVSTYGKAIGTVVDLYSNGQSCLDGLKSIYGYSKCSNNAKSTYKKLIDDNVNKSLSSLVSTQNKLK